MDGSSPYTLTLRSADGKVLKSWDMTIREVCPIDFMRGREMIREIDTAIQNHRANMPAKKGDY